MAIEMKRRKVGKHHVVTMLPDFKEGQTVIVARIDERTAIVSLESPETVQEMADRLPCSDASPWGPVMARLAGRPNSGQGARLPRRATETEPDYAVSDADALAFATVTPPQRKGHR